MQSVWHCVIVALSEVDNRALCFYVIYFSPVSFPSFSGLLCECLFWPDNAFPGQSMAPYRENRDELQCVGEKCHFRGWLRKTNSNFHTCKSQMSGSALSLMNGNQGYKFSSYLRPRSPKRPRMKEEEKQSRLSSSA